MRWLALALLGLLAGCASARHSPDTPAEPEAVVIEAPAFALAQAKQLVNDGKLAAADRLLDGVVSHPSFGALSEEDRNYALYLAGWVAHKQRNFAKAHPLLVRATASEFADDSDWLFRMSAARELGNMPDAIAGLTTMARRWPASLKRVNWQAIYDLVDESRKPKADPAASFELHRALFEAQWHPTFDIEPSWTWKNLALLFIERGQLDDAEEVMARIGYPDALVSMRVDKRFDALRKKYPLRFDVRAGLERHLAVSRKRVEDHPDSLDLFVQFTYALLAAKRFEEVLTLTEPFMGYKPPTDGFVLRYEDWADQIIWVYNNRAKALQALGRYDEAVELLRTTTRKAEDGDINVSQSINLGSLLCRMERPREALETIALIGDMSSYGRTQYESVRLNAALQLNDQQQVQEAMTYLQEHRYDSLRTYQYALIKLGRLDEAAAVLIGRLQDLRYRSDALAELQGFYSPPGPPRAKPDAGYWSKLIERPDVKAAIDRVGRIESFDFLYSV
jgi:tetratricopeptide (TPR) repeat protein